MTKLPEQFVYLEQIDASIIQEIRYAGHHNFVGRPIPGYTAARCIMTRKAAQALAKAQKEATSRGYTLKVYDAYRPYRAVEAFLTWCADESDNTMRQEFYPHLQKSRLVPDGYIAAQSAHCRGSTVDVTLVPLPVPAQAEYRPGQTLIDGTAPKGVRFADNSIDMGTGFDVFDPKAHTENPTISSTARENRFLLRDLMQRAGFAGYDKEWWHFVLKDEPCQDAYNFVVA